jgi:putative SOS response-associated peptidase YedK
MCGRYALYGPHSRINEALLLKYCPEYAERYNIAPQSNILVIRCKPEVGRVGQLVKWGLVPFWSKDATIGNKLTNARGETVAEKPSFKTSFIKHRFRSLPMASMNGRPSLRLARRGSSPTTFTLQTPQASSPSLVC